MTMNEKYYCVTYNTGSGGNWVGYLIGKHKNFNHTPSYLQLDSYIEHGIETISIIEEFLDSKISWSNGIKSINDLKKQFFESSGTSYIPSNWVFRASTNNHHISIFLEHIDKIKESMIKNVGDVVYIHLVVNEQNHYALENRIIHLINVRKLNRPKNTVLKVMTKGMEDVVNISRQHGIDAYAIDSIELVKGSISEYKKLCNIINSEPDYKMFLEESNSYRNSVWKKHLLKTSDNVRKYGNG